VDLEVTIAISVVLFLILAAREQASRAHQSTLLLLTLSFVALENMMGGQLRVFGAQTK